MAVRFLTPNPADSAALTESSEASGLPAENVQDKRLPLVWKTTSSTEFEVTTIDDCETADFTRTNAPTETPDDVNFKEGSNSLNLGKSGGGLLGVYEKTESSPFNLTDKWGGPWIYVKDKTEFAEITITFGNSDTSHYFTKSFSPSGLTDLDADSNPWNDLLTLSGEPLQDWTVGAGSPNITTIDWIRIIIRTANAGDTIALGNIKMDFWRAAKVKTIDSCESIADWNKSTDATTPTLDSVTFKDGLNSINLGKSGGGTVAAEYNKTITTPVNLTNKHAGVWVYVKNKTEFSLIQIRFGDDNLNVFFKTFNASELTDLDADSNPWNDLLELSGEPLQDWDTIGSPDITAIDFIYILIQTDQPSDTIAHGNIKMDFWRMGLNVEFIEFDFTTAQAVTAAVIDGHDFDGTETDIKLDSSTDASTWTNRATFTFASGEAMAVFISSVSARYWRIIFSKAFETDVRSIGRIFIGTYVEPTRGMKLGWRRTLTDLSQTKRSFGGTVYADIRNKFWEVSFSISHEPEATLATLRTGLSTLGIGTSLWLALEPTANPNGPHTLYGYFTRAWSESEPLNDHFNVDFKFAEDL